MSSFNAKPKSANRKVALGAILAAASFACTGQLPGSFRLAQQEQTFNSQLQINTKIDLLWVVDNSSSMDVSQEKLREGFTNFAQKYMQPTWDIRVAVITTDTYLANAGFANYLDTTIPGTTGWTSPYVYSRRTTFQNPTSNLTLVDLSPTPASASAAFTSGVKYRDFVPSWGASYSRLLPGLHDGPIAGFCFEGLPYFLYGVTNCQVRDQSAYHNADHCLTPGASESSVTQCVNTVQNDTIHSGTAIIATMPPDGTPADSTWTQNLAKDFIINVTTGSAGHGSERGFGSLTQMIQDNENTATAFFRPGSLRGIIFVSDEDDQTMDIPASPPSPFTPWTYYSSTCQPKTVDGHTYTISTCPDPSHLTPIASVKSQLDSFFVGLDGAGATNPNYFVISIVALTGEAIQNMQASRNDDDANVEAHVGGSFSSVAVDRGDRYIQLGDLVGNGSLAMNIADPDYSVLLDNIGKAIIEKKSVFTLDRAPTSEEDMIVKIIHADGTSEVISSDKFIIRERSLVITDQTLFLSFKATDQIVINYQPKTVF